VANHRSTSLLNAVSIINDNPKLLLLEKHIGELTKTYQSFTIPKGESAPRGEAILQLAKFLGHTAPRDQYASLFRSQTVQVTPDSKIRFFSEKNPTGYLEYIPEGEGTYRKKIYGDVSSPYLSRKGSGDGLTLFLNPRTLLKYRPNAFESNPPGPESKLALLEPNLALVHQTIASNKNLRRVKVVRDPLEPESPDFLRFFENLRESLDPFSIDTSMAWEAPPIELTRNPALDQALDLGRS